MNYVAQNVSGLGVSESLDYTNQGRYNDTSGASSPATTGVGRVKTAIVDARTFRTASSAVPWPTATASP